MLILKTHFFKHLFKTSLIFEYLSHVYGHCKNLSHNDTFELLTYKNLLDKITIIKQRRLFKTINLNAI